MDPHPNPGTYPILNYVMSRLPSFTSKSSPSKSDVEQPPPSSSIIGQMPNLTDPKLLAAMTHAISDVSQARSVLNLIGDRPTHEEVDNAKAKLVDLEAHLLRQLEEIVALPRPPEIDEQKWIIHVTERETKCRENVENEKRGYKELLQKDEMHEAYEKLLKDAEIRLVKIYENDGGDGNDDNDVVEDKECEERVMRILQEVREKDGQRVDLSGQRLTMLPEAVCQVSSLVVLNLSTNKLSVTMLTF